MGRRDHRALGHQAWRRGAGRRLRGRPSHEEAARADAERDRGRCRLQHGREGARVAAGIGAGVPPGPGGARHRGKGGRRLLLRRVPLDHRSRAPLRAPARRPDARWPACRAVRRLREHPERPRRRRRAARPLAVRHARGHGGAPERSRLQGRARLARAEADRAGRHGHVRRDRDPAQGSRPPRERQARRRPDRPDRLRPAEHGGDGVKVVLLPGDGIGPEITATAVRVLDKLGEFEYDERLIGGAAIDATGDPLPRATLDACRQADAVLLAAVGGPKWDTTDPDAPRPEQGLLSIRKELGLFANLRPVRPVPALYDASPLKRDRIEGTDLIVVRELTGGIYFGQRGRDNDVAFDTCIYSVEEIERIARIAFATARAKVTSVDKANVLESSRLWREVVMRVHSEEFPWVQLEHMLVDNAAMQLVNGPRHFDTILTENMFGDILSDEAAMLTGSIGMLPSASLGAGGPGLFEPVHGSAPDIAGTGKANPLAMLGSVAMMLRHGFSLEHEVSALESAIDRALEEGLRTPDLGGEATTEEAVAAVLSNL